MNKKDWLKYHDKCLNDAGGDSTPAAEKYYAVDIYILCEGCPIDCKPYVQAGDCK